MMGFMSIAPGRRKWSREALWLLLLLIASAVGSQAQGRIWDWGANTAGQLGNGTTTSANVPGLVVNTNGIGALGRILTAATGDLNYTLALRNDGTVFAWGDNTYGQLGTGTTTASLFPVSVVGPGGVGFLTGITQLAETRGSSIALRSDGTVWAWGNNYYGQVGNGTTTTNAPYAVTTPTQVSGLTGITKIATFPEAYYILALGSNGTVWAWGDNTWGQLGDGTTTARSAPVQVSGLSGITQILAGSNTTGASSYALKSDGTVWAWGDNNYGQLGNGTTTNSHTPTQVSGLTSITALSASGNGFALALRNDGTVWAWGYNANGQLGNNTTTNSLTPTQVKGSGGTGYLIGITAIQAGVGFSLALTSSGTVWAWGDNTYGELGNSTTNNSYTPVLVSGLTGTLQIGVLSGSGQALRNDGTVWMWGNNASDQLGYGALSNSEVPVQVSGLTHAISLISSPNQQYGLIVTGYQLVWQDQTSGDTLQWLMSGSTRLASSEVRPGIPAAWKIVGTGDFNSGGYDDVLWQNTSTGEIGYWQMDGGTYVQYVQIAAPGFLSTAWRVAGAGNLSSSSGSPPNILLQNTSTGEIGYWSAAFGGQILYTQIAAPGAVATVWHIEATPDVNGDGEADFVFQNVMTGEVGYWLVDDGQKVSYTQLEPPGFVPTAWRIGGAL